MTHTSLFRPPRPRISRRDRSSPNCAPLPWVPALDHPVVSLGHLTPHAGFVMKLRTLLAPVLLAFAARPVAAQRQIDGSQFGQIGGSDANVWRDLFYELFSNDTVCGSLTIILSLGLIASFLLALWSAYKAARGDSSQWKKVIIFLLLGGLLANPRQVFGVLGLNILTSSLNALGSAGCSIG